MTNIAYDLDSVFQVTPDLEAAKCALIRESLIRQVMTDTGESREIVIEMIDAMDSMQEAVLNLTEGEPTTLADALSRYVEILETGDLDPERIAGELSALLAYPWPGLCKAPCQACDPDADAQWRWFRLWSSSC